MNLADYLLILQGRRLAFSGVFGDYEWTSGEFTFDGLQQGLGDTYSVMGDDGRSIFSFPMDQTFELLTGSRMHCLLGNGNTMTIDIVDLLS